MDPSPSLSVSTYFADFGLVLFAFFLVLLNGFFVAAEFAMVKLRSTKVEAIASQHGWRGHILRTVHRQLDAYLSACQLGITLASLGLGWVGEPAFAHLLEPLFAALGVTNPVVIHGAAFAVAFFIISYLGASWWVWHFGCGLGSRTLVEYYALFAMPLAAWLHRYLSRGTMFIPILMVLVCVILQVKITYSYGRCWFYGDWNWAMFAEMLFGPTK